MNVFARCGERGRHESDFIAALAGIPGPLDSLTQTLPASPFSPNRAQRCNADMTFRDGKRLTGIFLNDFGSGQSVMEHSVARKKRKSIGR